MCFALLGASVEVVVGHYVQSISPSFMLLATFLPTWFLFVLASWWSGSASWPWRHCRGVIILNISTAGAWFGLFSALRHLEPAVATAVVFGVGPMSSVFWASWSRSIPDPPRAYVHLSFWLVIGTVAVAFLGYISQDSFEHNAGPSSFLVGVTYCLISGASVVAYTFASKSLGQRGCSPVSILASRFPLLLAVSLPPALRTTPAEEAFTWPFLLAISLIVVLGNLTPTYLLQLAIGRLSPVAISIFLMTTPLVTFAIQQGDPRLSFSVTVLVGLVVCTIGLIGAAVVEFRMGGHREVQLHS